MLIPSFADFRLLLLLLLLLSIHSENSHQEGKHDAVAHNLTKDITTSGLLGVSGVMIPSEEIDFTYTGVGGTKHHHPMKTIKQKEKDGGEGLGGQQIIQDHPPST